MFHFSAESLGTRLGQGCLGVRLELHHSDVARKAVVTLTWRGGRDVCYTQFINAMGFQMQYDMSDGLLQQCM